MTGSISARISRCRGFWLRCLRGGSKVQAMRSAIRSPMIQYESALMTLIGSPRVEGGGGGGDKTWVSDQDALAIIDLGSADQPYR